MAIYETNDGRRFESESGAMSHQGAIDSYEASKSKAAGVAQWERDKIKAQKLLGNGDYDGALSFLNTCIKFDSKNANFYLLRGKAYYMKGEYKNAIADLTILINSKGYMMDFFRRDTYIARSYAYTALNEYDKSIADCNEALNLVPNFTYEAYLARGIAYEAKGNMQQAISDYKAAVASDPEQKEAKKRLKALGGGFLSSIFGKKSSSTKPVKGKITFVNFFQIILGIACGVLIAFLAGWTGNGLRPDLAPAIARILFFPFMIAGTVLFLIARSNGNKILLFLLIVLSIGGGIVLKKPPFPFSFTKSNSPAEQTSDADETIATVLYRVNFRSAPSTSGNIIKTLNEGETLIVTGDTENNWTPVKHDNDYGYVSAEFISIEQLITDH